MSAISGRRVTGLLRGASLARIAALGMTFAFSLVVGRALGPNDAGVVYAAVVGASGLGMVARFGTEFAVLRQGSALHGTRSLRSDSLQWGYYLRFCALASTACCLLAVTALQVVPLAADNRTAYTAFALSIPFQCLGVLCSSLLRAGGCAGRGAFAEVGLAQGIAAVVTAVLALTADADPTSVGVAFALSWALVCGWSLLAVKRVWQASGPAGTTARRTTIRSLFAMMTSSLLFYILTWAPLGVLLVVASQTDVAWYGAAARFPTLIALVPTIQLTAGLPLISMAISRGRIADANQQIRHINVRATAVALASGAVLIAGGPWIMALFGPGFDGAVPVLTVLVLGQVAAVVLGPASTLPLVTGYERHAMVALCVTLPVAVCAEVLLASRWGAVGAAAGWSVSVCVFGLAMAVVLRRGAGIVPYLTIARSVRPGPRPRSSNDG